MADVFKNGELCRIGRRILDELNKKKLPSSGDGDTVIFLEKRKSTCVVGRRDSIAETLF